MGRTEELDTFIRHTNLLLGWPADLHTDAWVTGNETGQRASADFTEYEPNEEQVEATKQANKVDSHLYHTYCQTSTSEMFMHRRASGMQLVNLMAAQLSNASVGEARAQPSLRSAGQPEADPIRELAQVALRLSRAAS